MGKEKSGKIIAIVALVVAVVGLSVGFAAFSSVLTINTTANVTPDSKDFKVEFQDGSTVSPTGKAAVTLSNNGDSQAVISNIVAELAKPGDTVTVTIPIKNTGNYAAYLKSIDFTEASTKCTKPSGSTATDALVTAACADFTIKLSVGSDTDLADLSADKTVTTAHSLAKGASENLVLTISYAGTAGSGNTVDGKVSVNFGSIALNFSSAA